MTPFTNAAQGSTAPRTSGASSPFAAAPAADRPDEVLSRAATLDDWQHSDDARRPVLARRQRNNNAARAAAARPPAPLDGAFDAAAVLGCGAVAAGLVVARSRGRRLSSWETGTLAIAGTLLGLAPLLLRTRLGRDVTATVHSWGQRVWNGRRDDMEVVPRRPEDVFARERANLERNLREVEAELSAAQARLARAARLCRVWPGDADTTIGDDQLVGPRLQVESLGESRRRIMELIVMLERHEKAPPSAPIEPSDKQADAA